MGLQQLGTHVMDALVNCSSSKRPARLRSLPKNETYEKVLRQGMGIQVVTSNRFQLTLKTLHPIVSKNGRRDVRAREETHEGNEPNRTSILESGGGFAPMVSG